MATKRGKHAQGEQGDLFVGSDLFPVRRPAEATRPVDLSLRIKTVMGKALKECPDSAGVVAAKIADMTGRELTADALYAYTAPSKPEHAIDIIRFVAFVRATGAMWLWDELVHDDGLVVLQEREALFAQAGLLRQQQMEIAERLDQVERELKVDPVVMRPRGGRS